MPYRVRLGLPETAIGVSWNCVVAGDSITVVVEEFLTSFSFPSVMFERKESAACLELFRFDCRLFAVPI